MTTKRKTTQIQTIAGVLGNVLEWYDFALYGFFSDIIAQVFFPPGQDNLLLSYVVFGGAFVARPFGGLIAGHVGDKHGRKRALVMSMISMSIPTFIMGCLPGYSVIGGWSTALLIICRLAQGLSVGGQLPASVVYTVETKPKEHWGYYGAYVSFAAGLGGMLGNLVGAFLRQFLTEAQLLSWGWRIPFLSGILMAAVAGLLQYVGEEHNPNEAEYSTNDSINGIGGVEESEHNSSVVASFLEEKHPIKEALRKENLPALFSSMLVPMLGGCGWYITYVWMAVYMETILDPPVPGAFWINLAALVLGNQIPSLLTGWWSDKVGRTRLMLAGAILTGITGPFFVWIISYGKTVGALLAQTALGIVLSFYTGPLFAYLPEKFPPKIRLTSFSLGYNIGICISAGFSPTIATALVQSYGDDAPGYMYSFFAAATLIGMFLATKIRYDDGGIDDTTVDNTTIDVESEPNVEEEGRTSPLLV
eukprot:scaffold2084_cov155-Skeletonema_menzelii.AAC.10